MRERKIDGLIVTDPVSIYYYAGQKIPTWQKGRPSVFILPLESEPVLISWSGPEMFSRVYHKPYPSWVRDRRIYLRRHLLLMSGSIGACAMRSMTEDSPVE